MRDAIRLVGLAALLTGATFWLLSEPGQTYEPKLDPKAYFQFAFENNLENLSGPSFDAAIENGSAAFGSGPTGQSYHSQGDGSALVILTPDLNNLAEAVEIEFDFLVEDWINPYEQSAPVQTMLVLSGKSGDKIRHLRIEISTAGAPKFRVGAESAKGEKAVVIAAPGDLMERWHNVRVLVDRTRPETGVFLNNVSVGSVDFLPSVFEDGIDRIKIGTWHQQNQAFRGQIDNLVLRDVSE